MANLITVIISIVAYMVIGMLWYSPKLFGNKWMKLLGMKKIPKADTGSYVWAVVAATVMAIVLGILSLAIEIQGPGEGIQLAFWLWLGFIATTQINVVLWERKPWNLYFINTFQVLIGLMVMGAILGA